MKIENFKFIVEFYYDDLTVASPHSIMERHVIWTYQNLKLPLESYKKQDRKIILEHLKEENKIKEDKKRYVEAMYQRPIKNIVQYEREEPPKYIKALEEPKTNGQEERKEKEKTEDKMEEPEELIKNQILVKKINE